MVAHPHPKQAPAIRLTPNMVEHGAKNLNIFRSRKENSHITVSGPRSNCQSFNHRGTRGNFWVDGDYHLKSQAGRWDPATESWVTDDITSPCIDAGDPNSPIGNEPFPNGGIINIGAYGGTAQASKSYFGGPVCETIVAGDLNGDCKVDFVDVALMSSHWLEDRNP